jgi:hypothetical protein
MEVAQLTIAASWCIVLRNKGHPTPGSARAPGGTCAPVTRGAEGRAPGQELVEGKWGPRTPSPRTSEQDQLKICECYPSAVCSLHASVL